MKVTISTDNNQAALHFGRCPEFTIVEIENNQLIKKETIENPGHHPGYLPEYFKNMGIDCIVCGGMGQRAQLLFDEAGIKTITGISGSIDEVVNNLIAGSLESGANICEPGEGRGYGVEKSECDHPE